MGLQMPCPQAGCNIKLSPEMFPKYLSEDDKPRYHKFRLDDFVGENRCYVGCPTPGCRVTSKIEQSTITQVHCTGVDGACGKFFCTGCNEDGHRPAPCATAEKWRGKEDELNQQYIYANTRACPRCKIRIEKNDGCMHMTCKRKYGGCGHNFCWLCKGDWSEHGAATIVPGDGRTYHYSCNIYVQSQAAGKLTFEQRLARKAKEDLKRYSFHADRFNAQIEFIGKAKETFENLHKRFKKITREYKGEPNTMDPSELKPYLEPAIETVIDCRRVLMWTYPIGFYMSDDFSKKDLFLDIQAQAEVLMETLHTELEKADDLTLLDPDFKTKILHLTRMVRDLRKNLAGGVEDMIHEDEPGTRSLYTTQQEEYAALMK